MSTRAERLGYLAALVRMEIRQYQRAIDKFESRPGQDPEEAKRVLDKFLTKQRFRREVAEELRRQIEGEK